MKTTLFKVLVWVFGVLLTQPLWAAESEPEMLIRQTTQTVLQEIKKNQPEYKQDPSKLYQMVDNKVLKYFDFGRMTDLALGRYKRKVEQGQRNELVTQFRTLLVRTYGKALLEYNDEVILYLPMRGDLSKGEVTVRTEVEQKGGFPIPINYDMALDGTNWTVYDISIDNISLVTNYRSSFAKEIKAGGVDALIKKLQARNTGES